MLLTLPQLLCSFSKRPPHMHRLSLGRHAGNWWPLLLWREELGTKGEGESETCIFHFFFSMYLVKKSQ